VREAHGVVNGVRAAISAYRRCGHDGNGDAGRAA
jgi:hypothetical protein